MSTPYYDQDGIQIFHGDCREILPQLEPESVGLVLTDPPYGQSPHKGARTINADRPLVDFASTTSDDLREMMATLSPSCTRWFVATMDWSHIAELEKTPPEGWRFVRFGVWVKPNGAPQFTGDRPATGWEGIAILHRDNAKLSWNGGGRRAVWIQPKIEGDHPTQKPEPLVREWIRLFSNPGDLILDPFMGSGTTLRAAKDLGRRAIGIELEEKYVDIAIKRLQQAVLPLEVAS